MTDQQFLWWIHERLVNVHSESEMVDYMHHLRAIIANMPKTKTTANVARMDTEVSALRKRLSSLDTNTGD